MDNKQRDEQQSRLSRSQYRQQRENEQRSVNDAPENTADQTYSRETVANQRHDETVAEKTARLKRRLNIVIVTLIVAIIIVYLILFYVG